MSLVPARCKNCGAFISADDSHKFIICPYCRKKYSAEEAIRNFNESENDGEHEILNDENYIDRSISDFVIVGGVLQRYKGESTIVSVPSNVREISSNAFQGLSQISLVTLPEGLRIIQESAFRNCISLTSIYIPQSVTKIGEYAFEGCSALTAVNISDNIRNIGTGAFRNCSSLSLIHVISGVMNISNSLFEGCSSLKELRIADGVTHIGSSAFKDCASLSRLYIPDTVTGIGDHAFAGCNSLTSIYLPESIVNLDSGAFMNCRSLGKIILGEGIRNIGDGAFEGCISLTAIALPDSVRSVGRGIFNKCSSLSEIAYSPDLLPTLDRGTVWSGITCNPFEGSLMSEKYDNMGQCPRCGGNMVFVTREDNRQVETNSNENVPGFLKNAFSRSPLLQKFQPKTKQQAGYYDSSYYKCLSCKFKKFFRQSDE